MSHRNGRHPPAPFAHRGREHDIGQVGQAFAEFCIRGFGDPRDRSFGSPPRYIGGSFAPPGWYYEPRDSYPPADYEQGGCGAEQKAMKHFRQERPNEEMAEQGKVAVSFSKAMKKLHKELMDAETAYQTYQDTFDGEMNQIRGYATRKVMVNLWDRKWTGKKEKEDSDAEESSETTEIFMQTHEKLKEKLESALRDATGSVVEGKGSIQLGNADRLQQKVHVARKQILDLLKKVPDDRDYCASLLSELTLLRNLVDPETSKMLFAPGGGSGDGANNAEEQEQEQDGRGAGGGGTW
ncbi:uncharacterized protein RAG0_12180 [Rhynchosporium agropyri]|uniref:Uncharacterized protein n=1 Tax=Rhynchosporium agropyri TaxID=914238 RepID=A0A1E1L7J6_9HELO|nr:uncharacterized protein RAG0_12180 [Rhynchosporium agropyri]